MGRAGRFGTKAEIRWEGIESLGWFPHQNHCMEAICSLKMLKKDLSRHQHVPASRQVPASKNHALDSLDPLEPEKPASMRLRSLVQPEAMTVSPFRTSPFRSDAVIFAAGRGSRRGAVLGRLDLGGSKECPGVQTLTRASANSRLVNQNI